jgi:leucyl aminopeptidase
MQLQQADSFAKRPASDVLILPFWQESKKGEPACQMDEFRSVYNLAVHNGDFQGKEGELLFLYAKSKKEHRFLLLGLGKKSECTEESIRKAYAAALKECRSKKLTSLSVALPKTDFSVAYPATEGLLLANYAFEHLKSKRETFLVTKICLIGIGLEELKACRRAQTVVKGVNFARDLVNGNADDVTPQMLAKTAKELEKDSKKIKTTLLDKKALEKLGMGLLLAVNRASVQEPVLILVHYQGDPHSSDLTALVGKGITYDTGGLILKPKGSMETMKDDMSGAATVLGVAKTAAALNLKVNLIAAIPSTENAIGSRSYKPGDVYKSYSGKMVEIADTDAEGRLVLADAISYVQDHYQPRRIIDLATLTGGVVVALGEESTGLFCNDDKLSKDLIAAGNRTYERLWRLPLFKEYREALKSNIADIKNAADRKASPITGAIFIQEFVHQKMSWAHLDIAGTAYKSPRHYHTTEATGVGVRLLIDYLLSRETKV